jgi:hypothetical protein
MINWYLFSKRILTLVQTKLIVMIFVILIWVFLTLFSLFGGAVFLGQPFYDYFCANCIAEPIALIINFYLCNSIALVIVNSSLGRLNRILLYFVTGLILLVVELYLSYYLIFEVFRMNDKWVIEIVFLLAMIFVPLGGIRYFIGLAVSEFKNHTVGFFDGLQKNTQNRFLENAKKRNTMKAKPEEKPTKKNKRI